MRIKSKALIIGIIMFFTLIVSVGGYFAYRNKVGNMNLTLKDITEANNFEQVEGLPHPTMIELNSDQIWKCNLLVTLDLIDQKIIFRKL